MNWFNYYGLIFVVLILVPNIVFAIKQKGAFVNTYDNKAALVSENVSRYACMLFMTFNIPYTWVGFYFRYAEIIYLAVNGLFVVAYCLLWIILWKKKGIAKAILLSALPSFVFLFSGVMIGSIPLFGFAVVFSVTHILISVKNALPDEGKEKVIKRAVVTVTALGLSLILVAIVVLGGIIGYGQSRLSKLSAMSALDMIEYDVAKKNTVVNVAVIEDGKVSFRSFGDEKTTHDYEIGSISKTFVGLLCAKAVREGKLDLQESVGKYLGFRNDKYYPTIESLLTHTSGYKAYYFDGQMIVNKLAHVTNDYYAIGRDAVLKKAQSISLEDKDYPFVYSNFGIAVVGLLLERIYQGDFSEIMNTFIREELHLNHTVVGKQSGDLGGYWKWRENDGYVPAGAIVSNVEDMATYLSFYLNDEIDYASDTYRKRKTIGAGNSTYEKMNIRTDAIGLTWMLDEKNGIVWHNGGTSCFNSYIGFTADKKKGVVLLGNLSSDERISLTVIGAKLLTE